MASRKQPVEYKRRKEYRWLRSDGTPDFSSRIYRVPGDMEIIAKREVVKTSPRSTIHIALELMAQTVRSIVITSGDKLEGLLFATTLINYLGGGDLFNIVVNRHGYDIFSAYGNEYVETIMVKDPVVAYVDEKLTDVLEKMVLYNIGFLPVVYSDNRVYGVVSEHDLVRYLYRVREIGVRVEEVMSKPVVTIERSRSIWDAMKQIIRYGFRRLPVIEEDRVVGMVTAMDLVRYFDPKRLLKNITSRDIREALNKGVEEVMVRELLTAHPEDDLGKVVKEMIERDKSSVLVIDRDMVLQGIVTERDVLYALTTSKI